jgi:hypothetical protein
MQRIGRCMFITRTTRSSSSFQTRLQSAQRRREQRTEASTAKPRATARNVGTAPPYPSTTAALSMAREAAMPTARVATLRPEATRALR